MLRQQLAILPCHRTLQLFGNFLCQHLLHTWFPRGNVRRRITEGAVRTKVKHGLICSLYNQGMAHRIHASALCFRRQAHGKFQGIFSEVSAQINRVIVDLSCTVKIFCTVQHHLNRHFSLRCTKMQHHTVRRSGNEAGSFKCFFFCIFILHTADRAVQIEFAAVQRSSHQAVHCRAAVLPPTLRLVLYTIMYSHPVSPFCHQKREADDSTSLFVFQFLSNT